MKLGVLRHWKYVVFCLAGLAAATATAQSDEDYPPLNPSSPVPWVTPESTPEPGKGAPTQPDSPVPGAPGMIPSPEGLDFFDDDDDGGSSGSAEREGKNSFVLVNPPQASACKQWGHPLLDSASFIDLGNCNFRLERRIDRGTASVEKLHDRIERLKLKKVIQGELPNRAKARSYAIGFDQLLRTLKGAAKSGCLCID